MSYDFNANEVFEMAEQMERNGGKFYRTSAESAEDPDSKKFLLELAEMEDQHERTFKSMRAELTAAEKASTVFDPQGEAALYLRALADTRVFFEKEIDVSSMKAILKSIQAMDDRVKKLTGEGNDLLQNAKDVKPVTKVKAASSNTKTSIKAVDVSKDLMKEMTGTITGDLENLAKKITDLGGSVDEE